MSSRASTLRLGCSGLRRQSLDARFAELGQVVHSAAHARSRRAAGRSDAALYSLPLAGERQRRNAI
jgi:hypothetical protein